MAALFERFAPGFVRFWARVLPQLARTLIALFLIAAFTGTTAVLLFVITAEQLQTSIETADLGPLKVSIGARRRDVASVERYYDISGEISKRLVNTENELFQANVAERSALTGLVGVTNRIRSFINLNDTEFILTPLKVRSFQDQQSQADAERAPVFDHAVATYFAQYYAALDRVPASTAVDAARKSLEAFKDKTYRAMDDYSVKLAEYNVRAADADSLRRQLVELQAQQKGLEETVAPSGSALANTSYWNLCEDFFSFKSLVGDWAYHIVLLPKMMLVLLLAIFMGILGSLINIAQEFLRNPKARAFWDILFRIGLGAGVAFALFFFAAAGMMAFSQAPPTGADKSDMSPYLISFLGITGGYLSDRVMDWMRQVGENAFKLEGGDQPPRWATGLAPALDAGGLDAAGLASACNVGAGDVEGWASLAKPVPGDRQNLVAAFLRLHPSRIFTDIAPARRQPDEASPASAMPA